MVSYLLKRRVLTVLLLLQLVVVDLLVTVMTRLKTCCLACWIFSVSGVSGEASHKSQLTKPLVHLWALLFFVRLLEMEYFFLKEKGNYIKLSIIKRKESFHHLMTLVALVNEINALEMDRVPLNTESRI
jgi:hypothetical protein